MAYVRPNAGLDVAKIVGQSLEMDAVAEKLRLLAVTESAKHTDDGTFGRSIKVAKDRSKRGHGVVDRVVTATDPLAIVKELGHVVRNESGGPILGYVRGQHTMANAVKAMPEIRGEVDL